MSEQSPPDENEDDARPARGPQDADADDVESRWKTQRERTLGIVVVGVIAVVALFAFIIYPRFLQPLQQQTVANMRGGTEAVAQEHFTRSIEYINEYDFNGAMRELDSAVELDGENPQYRLLRAIVAVQLERYSKALRDLDTVIEADPGMADAYGLRANVHLLQEDYDRALDDANYAISLDSETAHRYLTRAKVYQAKGDYERALEDADDAILLDPANPEAYRVRAYLGIKVGSCMNALADANIVTEMVPSFSGAYLARIAVYLALEQYEMLSPMRRGRSTWRRRAVSGITHAPGPTQRPASMTRRWKTPIGRLSLILIAPSATILARWR